METTIKEITDDIALQIATDTSRANLEQCLERVRDNYNTLGAAQAQMDKTLYELLRAREFAEAMQESNQHLEARIYLLLGAFDHQQAVGE